MVRDIEADFIEQAQRAHGHAEIEHGFIDVASARDIDEAMLDFGMPMGPLRLLDEVGLDVAHHICVTLSKDFPDRMSSPAILDKMLQAGFLGKKSGRGFYVHSKGGKTELNTAVESMRIGELAKGFTRDDLQER